MSLLRLPNEILTEIIFHVFSDDSSSATPLQNGLKFAHTCRLIRSLSIPSIYSTVHCNTRTLPIVHSLLSSSSYSASSVRCLEIPVRYAPGEAFIGTEQTSSTTKQSPLPQEIMRFCSRVEKLVLFSCGLSYVEYELSNDSSPRDLSNHEDKDFNDSLLLDLTAQFKLAVKAIVFRALKLETVVAYLKQLSDLGKDGCFRGLQKLSITSCQDPFTDTLSADLLYMLNDPLTSHEWEGGALESITTLTVTDCIHANPEERGAYLARMVPNVSVLVLTDVETDGIVGMLRAYRNFGWQPTDIRISFGLGRFYKSTFRLEQDICSLIPSQTLKRFVLHGATLCDELFKSPGAWSQLEVLEILCEEGCKEVDLNLVHHGLKQITQDRPEVSMFVAARDQCLVSWNCSCAPEEWSHAEGWVPNVNNIFSAEEFEEALFQQVDSSSDSDYNYDPEYGFRSW